MILHVSVTGGPAYEGDSESMYRAKILRGDKRLSAAESSQSALSQLIQMHDNQSGTLPSLAQVFDSTARIDTAKLSFIKPLGDHFQTFEKWLLVFNSPWRPALLDCLYGDDE